MIAAVGIAQGAAHGQLEVLMVLPLLVLGPFYLHGPALSRRRSFPSASPSRPSACPPRSFGIALPLALRSTVFLLLMTVTCAIAARHLEKWSRKSFLEGHLIAELAQHDTLTGLKNRRVFDEHLEQLWQRAIENRASLAILMMDIDHFKAYNDRYGHQAGDQTLRRVAQTLQSFVTRPLDVLARFGGEEFAVILYDIDSRQAEALAERMRRAVGELAIEHRRVAERSRSDDQRGCCGDPPEPRAQVAWRAAARGPGALRREGARPKSRRAHGRRGAPAPHDRGLFEGLARAPALASVGARQAEGWLEYFLLHQRVRAPIAVRFHGCDPRWL